ncbi:MAG: GNAT family N-acetyltransferase [Oscillatoriaceae cyanobacterium]
MNSPLPQNISQRWPNLTIRPVQSGDLEAVAKLLATGIEVQTPSIRIEKTAIDIREQFPRIRRFYWLLKLLSWFPNPWEHLLCVYVAESAGEIKGLIQIAPFNRAHSTWRVERVILDPTAELLGLGSALVRSCLETIRSARMWLLEVNVNDRDGLALYRHNGFQPLAHLTYWALAPDVLAKQAMREPDLPNLLPVSNADAFSLCHLDTAAMPPLVRQVFDRHIHDFQTSLVRSLMEGIFDSLSQTEVVSGYVFEPQRQAAIGYFQVRLCRNGAFAHNAQLTVHPAYTWLYPELLSQMARIAQDFPPAPLHLASADYQPEREEYLEQIGAEPTERTMLMSRSVWHKLRESKSALETLQLSEMLPGFQPSRKPVPSRISWLGPNPLTPLPKSGQVPDGNPELKERPTEDPSQFQGEPPSDSYPQNGHSC